MNLKNIKSNTTDELFKNKWLAHGTMSLAGAILLFISWGAKILEIIDTSSTDSII